MSLTSSLIRPLALAAAVLLVPVAATAGASQSTVGPALNRVVAAGAPGAVAIVGHRSAAAGVADLHDSRPPRAGDPIRIGSVTKSFTAVIALQIVGEGRLGLDDSVDEHLPGVLPYGARVTVRQLLNHTSGVPDDIVTPLMRLFAGDRARVWTPTELLALVRDRPQRFPAGTSWAYSNADYLLVGLIIERVTGRPLEQELDERIVRPLHLRRTSFPIAAPRLGSRVRGYSLDLDDRGRPVPGTLLDMTDYSPSFAWASGNAVSSVRDVARFYRALLGGRLLAPALLREALTTVATGRPGRHYGLGLNVRDTPYGRLYGHDGDMPGFSTQALASRDGRRQAIVAVNVKFAPDGVDDAFDAAVDAAMRAAFHGSHER